MKRIDWLQVFYNLFWVLAVIGFFCFLYKGIIG
jgi:flagellar biogenesis protein FliO